MNFELCQHYLFSTATQTLLAIDGKTVNLTYKESMLLRLIIEGETDKRRLMEIIWYRGVVGDGSYHKLLFELRGQVQKIGLAPGLIKTLPRRGCCFVGSIKRLDDGADADDWLAANAQGSLAEQFDESANNAIGPPVTTQSPPPSDSPLSPAGSRSLSVAEGDGLALPRPELPRPMYLKRATYPVAMMLVVVIPFGLGISLRPSPALTVTQEKGQFIVSVGMNQPPWRSDLEGVMIYKRSQIGNSAYLLCDSNSIKERSCAAWVVK